MPSDLDHVRLEEDREDAPFLAEQTSQSRPDATVAREKLRMRLMITLFTIILFVETGASMTSGPMTRIYESIACRHFYQAYNASMIDNSGQVPEKWCKGKEVQGEVAIVKGYGELFDALASIVLAVPYCLLADRYGRKPTICLSIPGFVLNIAICGVILWFSDIFPLRAVWLSSLAWLLGGGVVVAAAIIWTMMADVTTETQRAAIFFRFGVAVMSSEVLSSALSSWLMTMDPWIPMIIGWVIVIVGILLSITLPETMHAFPSQELKQSHGLSNLSLDTEGPGQSRFSRPLEKTASGTFRSRVSSMLSKYSFVTAKKPVMLLLSAFLVYRLSRGTAWFLVQYVSVRYGWTIAQANLLVSLKATLMVLLFLSILPTASWYLIHRRGTDSRQKDLILTKWSILSLMVGTLGIGLSPHVSVLISCMVIQTLGAGFVYTTRSLITTMIHRDQTARLYTIIEIIQALGSILASGAMTAVFQWGINLGGVWTGLAWILASSLFGIIAIFIWAVKPPPVAKLPDDIDEET